MRFGLIGFGAWGKQHAQAISGLPGLKLAAIACNSEASARAAVAAYPAARVTQNWRELLADPGIATIDVVVPNHLHAEIGIAALRAGKDVLLEKPMATTAADCDALLAAERESGRLVEAVVSANVDAGFRVVEFFFDELCDQKFLLDLLLFHIIRFVSLALVKRDVVLASVDNDRRTER